MSLRLESTDPESTTPAERRDELASICARGNLRLRGRDRADFAKKHHDSRLRNPCHPGSTSRAVPCPVVGQNNDISP